MSFEVNINNSSPHLSHSLTDASQLLSQICCLSRIHIVLVLVCSKRRTAVLPALSTGPTYPKLSTFAALQRPTTVTTVHFVFDKCCVIDSLCPSMCYYSAQEITHDWFCPAAGV